jgi:hypothetical protein
MFFSKNKILISAGSILYIKQQKADAGGDRVLDTLTR